MPVSLATPKVPSKAEGRSSKRSVEGGANSSSDKASSDKEGPSPPSHATLNGATLTRTAWIVCGALLVSHLPLLIQHFVGLYKFRPHYEFVPFVIAASVLLIWKRWPTAPPAHTRRSLGSAALMLLASALLLACGTLLNSPLLGAVSAVVCSGGLLVLFAGSSGGRELLSAWALLWLTIPPPFFLDGRLIQKLQAITSQASSSILNYVGVLHGLSGNVFRLPERSLFVAEACSGVHSQLVLVAVAAIAGVSRRRTGTHVVLLMSAAVFWSLVANIARVTAVVAAEANGWALAEGWQHEVLGYSLIVLGFGALMSTDQLLALLLGPIGDLRLMRRLEVSGKYRELQPAARLDYRVYSLWNRWVSGTGVQPAPDQTPATGLNSADSNSQTAASPDPPSAGRLPRALAAGLCVVFLMLGAAQIAVAVATPAGREVDGSAIFAAMTRDTLPATLGELRFQEHGTQERERNSDEGHFTHYWMYSSDSSSVRYSMDFPFVGWHELTDCYVGQGWKVVSREIYETDTTQAYVQALLSRPTGETAILCFALHDAIGQALNPNAPPITLAEKLRINPLVSMVRGQQAVAPRDMTVQFQQLLAVPFTPTETDLRIARDQFERARSAWMSSGFFAVPEHSTEPNG